MIWILVILIIAFFVFGAQYTEDNVGSLGYKTKNFHMSHGMSKKMFETMKQDGLSEETLKEFIMMEDRLLEVERKSVCSQTARQFEAVGVSDQIKKRFTGYDFSYHAKHIKQASEPEKMINRSITCA
jgi:Sec-independent protein translocase protein TatA